MSYLLDALRKSEDLKHRGAAPTIHSAERYHRPVYRSRWIGMTLLILLPLAILMAWYSWTDRAVEESSAPSTAADSANDIRQRVVSAPARRQQEAVATTAVDGQSEPTVAVRLSTERTPVERLESQTPSGNQASQNNSPGVPSGADTAIADPVTAPLASADVAGVRRPEIASSATADSSTRPVQGSNARASEYPSPRPGVINVWELPESVRKDLMGMKISVLVFAENPADRFLLMNGKRWVEGDEPQAGLLIEEIRREGVVFSFRLYQFLVSH